MKVEVHVVVVVVISSVHEVHKMNTKCEGPFYFSRFILETSEKTSPNFGMERLCYKLLSKFSFAPCPSGIILLYVKLKAKFIALLINDTKYR